MDDRECQALVKALVRMGNAAGYGRAAAVSAGNKDLADRFGWMEKACEASLDDDAARACRPRLLAAIDAVADQAAALLPNLADDWATTCCRMCEELLDAAGPCLGREYPRPALRQKPKPGTPSLSEFAKVNGPRWLNDVLEPHRGKGAGR